MPVTKLDQLKAITKLNKIHPSFGVSARLPLDNPILDEITRISGCVSTKSYYANNDGWVEDAKTLADRHNVPIVLNASPMHWFREPEHVALVKNLDTPTNDAVDRELDLLSGQLARTRGLMGGSVPAVVLLDCEQFVSWRLPAAQLDNLRQRYDMIYDVPKTIFGADTEVWWYNFTPRRLTYQNGDNWSNKGSAHGIGEKTAGTAFSHYFPREIPALLEGVHHTAIWPGFEQLPMSVWVSLGSEYERPNRPDKSPWHHNDAFNADATYEHYYSWWAGLILNAPWRLGARYMEHLNKVKMVCFYPGALEPTTPKWLDYFISYCHGAMRKQVDWTPAADV